MSKNYRTPPTNKGQKSTLQERNTLRFPLIYTSEKASVQKRWQGLEEQKQSPDKHCKLTLKTSQYRAKAEKSRKVDANFLNFFFLFPTKAICFHSLHLQHHYGNHIDREDPLLVLDRNLGDAKKKNQWRFLLMSLQDAVIEDQKNSSRSPQTRLTLPSWARGAMMDVSKATTWLSFKQDNSCQPETKNQDRFSPLWFGVYNLRSVQVKLWLLQQ